MDIYGAYMFICGNMWTYGAVQKFPLDKLPHPKPMKNGMKTRMKTNLI